MPKRIPLSSRTAELCRCGCGEYVPLGPYPSTQPKYLKGHRYVGKNNPNYRGGKVDLTCPICGVGFQEFRSHAWRRVTCAAKACYAEHHRRKMVARGVHKVTVTCTACGATIRRFPSLAGGANFCNAICLGAYAAKTFRGPSAHGWKGGRVRYMVEQTRQRDGHKCVVCGWGLYVEVHHITARRAGGADTFSNLLTLCPNHHSLADRHRFDLEPYRRTDWLPEGYVEPATPTHGPRLRAAQRSTEPARPGAASH